MLQRTLIFSSLFICLVCLIAYIDHVRIRPSDYEAFRIFSQQQQSFGRKHSLGARPIVQNRIGVQKDIWTEQNGKRVHTRLKSESSELVLANLRAKLEAKEILLNLECFCEGAAPDSLYAIVARQGTYTYPAHSFQAEDANVYFFKSMQSTWPNSIDFSLAYFQSRASHIDAFFAMHPPLIEAKNIRAILNPLFKGSP